MRKYSEAWAELKIHKRLEIAAPRAWHRRIHNGIRKERYKDLAHSLWLAEEQLFERMSLSTTKDTMVYVLVRKPKLNVQVTDLF